MIKTPKKETLAKYGLSEQEWREIHDRQGGACFVCQKEPSSGRLCIDHEHERGWKKMPPERRKLAVRGLTCFFCNYRYLARGMTIKKAMRLVEYLTQYAQRRGLLHDRTIRP